MILHCNFEELRALASAGEAVVAAAEGESQSGAVQAPAEGIARVEMLLPRLTGDFSIETLQDQRRVRAAVGLICDDLRGRMDQSIIEHNPAHEEAVTLYFDYGHSRSVLHRLDVMGSEMEAIVDLITGGHPEIGESIPFPD
ncbi:MAG TPA: hypothetical protein VF665_09085 [Longimicrobium sp.]|jgi:hypothetical protein|uniref:hypothetical protein n=1 Tax=Longimicrobium sp. TaxID=2029185 RepID=UPI002ED7B7BB